jgi:predicted ABC-type transport system involved in lysophospholipase L1 biosynthesis ATPase subunit
MISLDRVSARQTPLALASVSLTWGPGVHALVGASTDGGALLLAIVAGAARVRSGQVRVLGGAAMYGRGWRAFRSSPRLWARCG